MNEHLKATLGLDARPFANGLRGAKGMAKNFADGIMGSGIAGKIGGFFGGLLAVGGIKNAAQAVLDYADKIGNAAESLDVSTDFLQAWNKQVTLSGGTTELAAKGLEELTRRLGDAADGSGDAADKFKKYGIDVRNADGTLKNTEQVVYDIAEVMKTAGSQAEANAIAFDLLGKSGVKLVNSLAGGREGLAESIDALKRFVPTQEEIQAVKELGDTLTGIKNTMLGMGTKVLAFLSGNATPQLPMVGVDDKIEELRKLGAKFVGDEPKKVSEETLKALNKLQDAKRKFAMEDATSIQRIEMLSKERNELQIQLAEAAGDATKQAELELSILEKQRDIQKELKVGFDEMAKRREEANKKDRENQELLGKFQAAKDARIKFGTLEELAGLDQSKARTSSLFNDIGRARQALGFRSAGEEAMAAGNQALAKRYFDLADANVAKISNLKQQEDIAMMLKQLIELNAKVVDGIIVIPKNAP